MMLSPLIALAIVPQVAQVEAVLVDEIGSADGNLEQVFGRVSDLAVGANGNIYVLDQQSDRVRIFSASGDYVSTFGQRGREAGQLNRPVRIDVRNETVTVLNPSSQSNSYSPTGQLLISDRHPFGAVMVNRLADGRYVVLGEGSIARDGPQPALSLFVTGPGVVDTVLTAPSSGFLYRAPTATSAISTSLCDLLHFAVDSDEALWVASGVDGTLTEWRLGNGAPARGRSIEVAPAGVPLPDSLRARLQDQLPRQIDAQSEDLYTPTTVSSICGLERGSDRTLWVRLGDVDERQRWQSVDTATPGPSMELLAPTGVTISAFSGDRAYGIRVDEARVTRVMVYRIE